MIALLAMAVGTTGCASWFMNGAQPHEGGAPMNASARFGAPSCSTIGEDDSFPGPQGQTYVLAQQPRGPVLYELDAQGEGAAIHNHWSDERGVHFFVWVANSHGWVYTFPHTRDQLPTRWVFPAGSYSITEAPSGAKMPEGRPEAACQMIPS